LKKNLSTLTTLSSIALSTLLFSGCGNSGGKGNGGGGGGGSSQGVPDSVLIAINGPMSSLTQDAKNSIAFMGNEERLAHDVYTNLYNYHLQNSAIEITPLLNIANNAEQYHINSVQLLVEKYITDFSDFTNINSDVTQAMNLDMDYAIYPITELPSGEYNIDSINELYSSLMNKGMQSQQDALEVGCMVEVTDINDLNEDLALASESNASDVVTVFEYLRDGSYSHYWSFDSSLINEGISEGCCSLGTEWCHPEYPQTERGGQGRGH
jgi:hypothetical protein